MRRLTDALRRYFLRGLAALLPVVLTLWILDLGIRFMETGVKLLPPPLRIDEILPFYFPGLGAVFTVLVICLIGVIVTHVISSKSQQLWERMLQRIPVVRSVYGSVRQLVEAIFSQNSRRFRQVVLIEYPRKGIYTLALVTGEATGEIRDRIGEATLNVFVPTTPNPTSGWYIAVPESEAIPLEMTVEDAFKVIISGGMVMPPPRLPREEPKRLTG